MIAASLLYEYIKPIAVFRVIDDKKTISSTHIRKAPKKGANHQRRAVSGREVSNII